MKQVIITIDTEGHRGNDPVERLIWGRMKDGKEYGINHIMDICDKFKARALFFVDIAEAWDYGKEKIASVITHIIDRGHDVGVHIHPDHMADKDRLFLWEYSKEEQFDIIKKCTVLYKEITGTPPVAFRAGKYGANRDTLDILDELGYKFDFSQFYGQKWCGINPPVAYVLPQRYKKIIEIPVTVYNSFTLGKHKRYDKIDAVMDNLEYKYIMNEIASNSTDIVVSFFYHSFSMLDWKMDPDNPKINFKEQSKFINKLQYIVESKEFDFTNLQSLEETMDMMNIKEDSVKNILFIKGFVGSFWFLFLKAYAIRKYNNKAKYLVYGTSLFLSIVFLLILIGVYYIL